MGKPCTDKMMDCDAYRLLITGYIDEELSEQEMHTLKAHLQTCEDCLTYLKRAEGMKTALKRYTLCQNMPEVPANFARNVSEQLQEMFEEERMSLGARLRTAYRGFVLDVVERWVSSLKTRPFVWTTSVSCLLLFVAGAMFLNVFRFSSMQEFVQVGKETEQLVAVAPQPMIRFEDDETMLEDMDDSRFATETSTEPVPDDQFAAEPFIRVAQNGIESVEDYVYSHVIEVYQEPFVDDLVFVGYVQNAFIEQP